jgi:hypothetical protein
MATRLKVSEFPETVVDKEPVDHGTPLWPVPTSKGFEKWVVQPGIHAQKNAFGLLNLTDQSNLKFNSKPHNSLNLSSPGRCSILSLIL